MFQVGLYAAKGLINGLDSALKSVFAKAKELGQKIIDGVKSVFNNATLKGIFANIKQIGISAFNLGKEMASNLLAGVKKFLVTVNQKTLLQLTTLSM